MIIAIVAALALLGVMVVRVVTIPQQQAEAASGCPITTVEFNASKGQCLHP